MNNATSENILGTRPIRRLLPGMAFPIILSMLVQALYNVVDSVFVSRVSEDALTAVSLVFPIQNLMIAVSVGTAVGINALLSRRLGEGNVQAANRVASNGMFITVLSWAAFALFGLVGSHWFMAASGASAAVAAQGTSYMRICTLFSLGLFVQITTERLLQVTGKTVYQMVSQMTGALANIVLDPILIFGLLGFPAMGVVGAAVATVMGQLLGMAVGLTLNHRKNNQVRLTVRGFRPCWRTIRGIYAVGLPSILMQSIGSIMVFGMNKILIGFSETAVSVFGVYFKLQSFVFMPVYGVTNALVPIVGFNYGAQKRTRIVSVVKLALGMCTAIMAAGTVLFQTLPAQLLALFDASEAMLAIGVPALRLISLHFCIAGVCIVLSCTFQALGDGVCSLWMSLIRQLALLLPCAWLLARFVSLNAVWLSFLIAECACLAMALFFWARIRQNKLHHPRHTPA